MTIPSRRYELTDKEWEKIRKHFPERTATTRGRPCNDTRTTINGILWIARSGAPWRDLPEQYGNQHIGMSRGGKNTKVHAVVDGLGNPVYVQLSAGNLHDVSIAQDVLSNVPMDGSIIMADKAYGSKTLRKYIEENGGSYCIPPKSNELNPWNCDWWQYKERHLVECFFQKLKQFRRVATRYDKLANRFLAFVHIACICILMK